MNRNIIAGLLLALLIYSGCGKTATGPNTPLRGVLNGKILDATTSAPIGGATVSFFNGKNVATTDANGNFEIDSLPIGNDILTVTKSDYITLTDSVEIATDHLTTYAGFMTPKFKGFITGWQSVNSGTTAVLINACFATKSVVYACGFAGTVLRSTDAGATWTGVGAPTQENLYCIHFSDALTGVIMGNNGAIFRTTDGGGTWNVSNGNGYNFRNLSFSDAFHGTAVGGINSGATPVLYRTTDGGVTWVDQSSSLSSTSVQALYGVAFANSTEGFVGGIDGQVLKTTDGGSNWSVAYAGNSWIRSIYFTDQNSGTEVGAGGVIHHTTDAGFSWPAQTGGLNATLNNVTNSDPRHSTIVGDAGTILHTRNAGAAWLNQSINGLQWKLNASAFADSVHGVVVGENGTIMTPVTQ